jgi:RNA polymerase sigma-70 factor (ECF subfamily)
MTNPGNLLFDEHLDFHQQGPSRLPCLSGFRARLLARAQALMGPQLRARVDPADVVHETLLKAYRARYQFRGSNERQLAAWLNVILTNTVKNAVRSLRTTISRRKRLQRLVAYGRSTDTVGPVRAAVWAEEVRRLTEAVAQLPPNQRVVLELRFIQGCSLAEVGNRTGRTKASASGLLRRALQTTRALLAHSC